MTPTLHCTSPPGSGQICEIDKDLLIKLLCLLLFSHLLITKSLGQLPKSYNYYNQIQGLPDNNVKAITQDKYGYIWIGTENGIARFDGKYFTTFNGANNVTALPDDDVYAMENADSNLIAVTTRRGLQIIDVKTMTSENIIIPKGPNASEAKANHLRRIHVDAQGGIIIVSRSGFYHYNREKQLVFRHDDYTTRESQNALSFGEYSLWLNATSLILRGQKGLYKYNVTSRKIENVKPGDSSFLLFRIPELFKEIRDHYILQPQKGIFIFLKYNSDSLLYVNEMSKIFKYSKTLVDSIGSKFTWRSKVFSRNDSILLISGKFQGLYTLYVNNHSGTLRLDTTASFSIQRINSFFTDSRNKCWIGFNDGLAGEKMSPINLQLHPSASLYEAKSTRKPVLQTANTANYVYAATQVSGGLYQFNKTSLAYEKHIPINFPSIGNKSINAVASWVGDSVLCGTDVGLYLYDEHTNTSKYVDMPGWNTRRNFVANLFLDSKQNMWITCNKLSGCYVWKAGEKLPNWFPIDSNYKQQFKEVYHIAEDNDGNIWFAGYGIIRYNKRKQQFDFHLDGFSKSNGEPTPVSAIAVDRNGLVWAANGISGLVCVDPISKHTELFATRHGLTDEAIKGLKYHNGYVYILSKNGICKINAVTKHISVVSTNKDVHYKNYFSNKLELDAGTNSMFTGAGSSVIRFEPDYNDNIKNDPQLILVFVKPGNDSITWFPKSEMTVNWKNRNITLFYNAINYEDADYQKYAYRTIRNGHVSPWIMQDDQRRIIFSDLDKGDTEVDIKVYSPQNAWPPKTIKFTIHVITPFWKATWFYLLCTALFLALLIAIYRQREKQVRHIFNIRDNISKDLHDEIGATLSGIAMYSHLVKNSVDNNEGEAAKHAANIIQESAAEMVTRLNDIIWLTNPDKDSLQDIIVKLKAYAQKLCIAKNIAADIRVIGEAENMKPPIETRKNIYLFCREAINNVAKYSHASSLFLEFRLHANNLKITIRDNGVGFDMANVKKGNGLDNMRKRADELGADFSIQSEPLQGSTILLSLKITQRGIGLH